MTNAAVDTTVENIGEPKGFCDNNKDTSKENPFLLSQSEWISIQRYIANALQLPITDAQMRLRLGMQFGDDISPFMNIVNGYEDGDGRINGYRDMYNHCKEWKERTYPFVVSLAHDIRHYANDVPEYYDEIIKIIESLSPAGVVLNALKKPRTPKVQKQYEFLLSFDQADLEAWIDQQKTDIENLLEDRRQKAEKYAANADKAYKMVDKFATDSAEDYKDLKFLLEDYQKQFGSQSERLKTIKKEIEDFKKILDQTNADYDHSVVVASTTATYAWVFPFGSIAAVIVAGVYGDKAVKLKNTINELTGKLNALGDEEAQRMKMESYLKLAVEGMQKISDDLKAALPTIGKIKGIWEAIAKDLEKITADLWEAKDRTETDPTTGQEQEVLVPGTIKKIKLEATKAQWKKVEQAADGFVVNAYIEVTDTSKAAA